MQSSHVIGVRCRWQTFASCAVRRRRCPRPSRCRRRSSRRHRTAPSRVGVHGRRWRYPAAPTQSSQSVRVDVSWQKVSPFQSSAVVPCPADPSLSSSSSAPSHRSSSRPSVSCRGRRPAINGSDVAADSSGSDLVVVREAVVVVVRVHAGIAQTVRVGVRRRREADQQRITCCTSARRRQVLRSRVAVRIAVTQSSHRPVAGPGPHRRSPGRNDAVRAVVAECRRRCRCRRSGSGRPSRRHPATRRCRRRRPHRHRTDRPSRSRPATRSGHPTDPCEQLVTSSTSEKPSPSVVAVTPASHSPSAVRSDRRRSPDRNAGSVRAVIAARRRQCRCRRRVRESSESSTSRMDPSLSSSVVHRRRKRRTVRVEAVVGNREAVQRISRRRVSSSVSLQIALGSASSDVVARPATESLSSSVVQRVAGQVTVRVAGSYVPFVQRVAGRRAVGRRCQTLG